MCRFLHTVYPAPSSSKWRWNRTRSYVQAKALHIFFEPYTASTCGNSAGKEWGFHQPYQSYWRMSQSPYISTHTHIYIYRICMYIYITYACVYVCIYIYITCMSVCVCVPACRIYILSRLYQDHRKSIQSNTHTDLLRCYLHWRSLNRIPESHPLVNKQFAIEPGPVEIMDLPMNSMVDLSIVFCMLTRG